MVIAEVQDAAYTERRCGWLALGDSRMPFGSSPRLRHAATNELRERVRRRRPKACLSLGLLGRLVCLVRVFTTCWRRRDLLDHLIEVLAAGHGDFMARWHGLFGLVALRWIGHRRGYRPGRPCVYKLISGRPGADVEVFARICLRVARRLSHADKPRRPAKPTANTAVTSRGAATTSAAQMAQAIAVLASQ